MALTNSGARLFLLGFVALVAPMQAGEVARVGDTVVTMDALRQNVARKGYNIFNETSVRKGLDDVIQFELLAAEAKKLGLDREPQVARQINELLVQKLLVEKVDGPLAGTQFSEVELRSYYDTHTSDFRKPAIARGNVLTILVAPGKESEAEAKAKQALEEWKSTVGLQIESRTPGTPNLGKGSIVVKKYSDDPAERLSGGQSDFFVEGQPGRRYPLEVEQAMLKLKFRGEVTGPIATPRALYLVGLAERRDAQQTPFEQATPEVQRRLLHERRDRALAAYCDSLKQHFPVTINEGQLKAAVESSKPGGGPPQGPVELP